MNSSVNTSNKKKLNKKTLKYVGIGLIILAVIAIIVILILIFLKPKDEEEPPVTPPPGPVTPPVQPPPPPVQPPSSGCYRQDWKAGGSHISTTTKIPDYKACQKLCQDDPECNHFDFDTSRNYCYMRRNEGSGSANPGWISGPKICADGSNPPSPPTLPPNEECFTNNFKAGGSHIETITKINDAYDCQTKCREDPECNWFDYDSNKGYCYKRRNKGSSGSTTEGWVSGPKVCGGNERPPPEFDDDLNCLLTNYKYTGPHIRSISKTTSVGQCQKYCQDEDRCTHFALDTNRDLCMLKEGKGAGAALDGWLSGKKVCDNEGIIDVETDAEGDEIGVEIEPESCFVQDKKYMGPHIRTQTKIASADECQKVCQDDDRCTHFAWNSKENKCYLKEGKGSAPDMEGWVSGPKNCPQGFLQVGSLQQNILNSISSFFGIN